VVFCKWHDDTWRTYPAVNGGQAGGNALLVFKLPH
jgi:hypothetical protein